MPHKDLTDLQTLLASVQNRFASMNDKSVEASEIARALEELISTVAVHRIRAEMRNSKFPFELKAS
jgi:hypothetical protein